MSINKFVPLSPDPDLNAGADMTLARFGHLNKLVDEINAGGTSGGGVIIEGEGTDSTIRSGVNNQAFGKYGSAIGGLCNITCNDYTANTFGRNNYAAGCHSNVNGISNKIVARNASIYGGMNNTIACDAPPSNGDNTVSSYAGYYFYGRFFEDVWPAPQILGLYIDNTDLTASWNVGDTISGTYAYAVENPSVGGAPSQIQFIDAEVLCAAYETYDGSCATWLYVCYDPNSPSWSGFIPLDTAGASTCSTYSMGYLQKTGTFSDYSTSCSSYHHSIILGGSGNTMNGWLGNATISGGYQNTISGGYAFIAGGSYNFSCNSSNTFINGANNKAIQSYTANIGGVGNTICNSNFTSILGGVQNSITCSGYTNMGAGRLLIARNAPKSTLAGGMTNSICFTTLPSNLGCFSNNTISGGYRNCIYDSHNSFIAGGFCNRIHNVVETDSANGIMGGKSNLIQDLCKTFIVGSDITADRNCTTFVNNLSIVDLPTSAAGLPSKSLWYDSTTCVVKFVP